MGPVLGEVGCDEHRRCGFDSHARAPQTNAQGADMSFNWKSIEGLTIKTVSVNSGGGDGETDACGVGLTFTDGSIVRIEPYSYDDDCGLYLKQVFPS